MVDLLEEFEKACKTAGLDPLQIVTSVGVGRSTWYRWKAGDTSPPLRRLRDAHAALEQAKAEQAPA